MISCKFAEVDRMPQRARVFVTSGCYRSLIEGPTVRLPSKRAETGDWSWHGSIWRAPFP
jgi:hypothetical protein